MTAADAAGELTWPRNLAGHRAAMARVASLLLNGLESGDMSSQNGPIRNSRNLRAAEVEDHWWMSWLSCARLLDYRLFWEHITSGDTGIEVPR